MDDDPVARRRASETGRLPTPTGGNESSGGEGAGGPLVVRRRYLSDQECDRPGLRRRTASPGRRTTPRRGAAGVCRTTGAPFINWFRLYPQVFNPWRFERLDYALCTHQHADHCDLYSLKAYTQTTNCRFVGPMSTVERMRVFGVPESRIDIAEPGMKITVDDVEIEATENFDVIATYTFAKKPGQTRPFREVAVGYLFKTEGAQTSCSWETLCTITPT